MIASLNTSGIYGVPRPLMPSMISAGTSAFEHIYISSRMLKFVVSGPIHVQVLSSRTSKSMYPWLLSAIAEPGTH
jgi:hypothetical protein